MKKFLDVIGIDPGTTTLGFAAARIDLETGKVYMDTAITLDASKASRYYVDFARRHGELQSRLYYLGEELRYQLRCHKVNILMCEDCFRGQNVDTFKKLVLCQAMIREALIDVNVNASMELHQPGIGKEAVGTQNSSDKTLVMNAIRSLENVEYDKTIVFDDLSEHACDAIAQIMIYANRIRYFIKQGNIDLLGKRK